MNTDEQIAAIDKKFGPGHYTIRDCELRLPQDQRPSYVKQLTEVARAEAEHRLRGYPISDIDFVVVTASNDLRREALCRLFWPRKFK